MIAVVLAAEDMAEGDEGDEVATGTPCVAEGAPAAGVAGVDVGKGAARVDSTSMATIGKLKVVLTVALVMAVGVAAADVT